MNRIEDEEQDPLLLENGDGPRKDPSKRYQAGPLEISKTTRYGILAGIWTATFLSVCNILLHVVRWSAQRLAFQFRVDFKVIEQ